MISLLWPRDEKPILGEKNNMLGMVSGQRRQGQPRTRWFDIIKQDTNLVITGIKYTIGMDGDH